MRNAHLPVGWFCVATLASTAPAGNNIDLSTVPQRDSVQLTIYNSEDLTLVRETRKITFKKGLNPLQFSWANTRIDASSVELEFKSNPDRLELLDTTFPHDKPQMLYWNVQSELDGEATVQISYFTSGITWAADYVVIANGDETALNVESFVRVTNNSGEDYENAQVRLVVGTINLVEKIAQMANVPASEVMALGVEVRREMRDRAMDEMLAKADGRGNVAGGGAGAEEKQIVKEGLSEYFIYTIEGTETIPNGWSKRLRSFEASGVPFKVQYRYRPEEYGEAYVRMYLLKNDKDSKLGTTPLPDGLVRVFRDNGRDGLSFLTQQTVKYIPIGDKIELNLGPDPEVICELIQLRAKRDNIWMQIDGGDVYRRVGDGNMRIDVRSHVAGWDDRAVFTQRVRNFSSKPIEIEVRRRHAGHVLFRSSLNPRLHDYQTVEFTATIPAGKRSDLLFEVVTQQGYNSKQNNVTLEAAEVSARP